jgi:hypothetical protein
VDMANRLMKDISDSKDDLDITLVASFVQVRGSGQDPCREHGRASPAGGCDHRESDNRF